ncbi:stage V sporulation protein AB [Fredinandcohnia salidurans]|jgi:stage V sporulation protein AB|uniref:Stage V sporulation protein AB n=1 Tax=Fredinandcohnia salidurans TaxID=2595041 RepID=A0ABW4MGW4_9BACI|nr:stage V sporulation protein AB [Fredinandcohnia onubensis]
MTIKVLLIIFLGLGSGLAVGGGFVAFLAVLGIIPRLTQLTKTMKFIRFYEWGVVFGAVFGSWFTLNDQIFHLWDFIVLPVGLASGIFVGMLAAALTEVLNVFPILAKRIGIENKIVILVMAIVFGKIVGSLFQWIYYVK